MGKRKEILVVYNEPPVQTSGGNIRVYNLIKALSLCKECSVTLLILPKYDDGKDIAALKKEFSSVNIVEGRIFLKDSFKIPFSETIRWWWSRYFILRLRRIFSRQDDLIKRHWQQTYCLRREIKNLLKTKEFDAMQIEHLYLADCIKNVKINPKTKIILDLHNVYSAAASGGKKDRLADYEKKTAGLFDCALVCSKEEKEHAEISGFKSVKIVPNGVDTDYFAFSKKNDAKKLLFIGDLSYQPNREAVLWFLKKIKPFIPQDMKVDIIGNRDKKFMGVKAAFYFSEYSDKQVSFHGYVADFRDYTKDAVFICPIKSGAGTRLKLLTAAAAGMPIITTSKGVEGIDFEDNRDVLIADTPYDFVTALNRLAKDKDKSALGEKIRYNARKIAEKKYSWKVIGKAYSEDVLSETRIRK